MKKYTLAIVINSIIIILMILGVIIYVKEITVIKPAISEHHEENIEVYFLPSELAVNRTIELIHLAEEEVFCAFRSLNHPQLESALISKEAEGKIVRLVVSSEYIGNTILHLPFVRFREVENGLMHNNYCIIDQETIFTGSILFNVNTINHNNQDIVIVTSKELADRYRSDFWRIYLNQSGQRENNFPLPISINENTSAIPYFCPYDNCTQILLDLINSAEKKIYFATYSFTNIELIEALQGAIKRGVIVKGIIEEKGLNRDSIYYQKIPGIKVDKFNYRTHTKMWAIDQEIAITGSVNPSYRSMHINHENIIIFNSTSLNKVYSDQIEHIYYFWE